ncbi:hypothetical protein Goari_007622 [Gossypium aridum]|uniref:Pectate lyase n=1 Tax=Gossypium aridum TaxID=34290 RepID=A0A7J8XS94_GOSAI|nr:hypothetical protein [Gossypium aridum]
MTITLQIPLLLSSFTAIDGRGVDVHITSTGCLLVYQATNIIIHGLLIHHCKAQPPSTVMGPNVKVITLGQIDVDAIRLATTRKVWIDHNTLLRHGYAHVANNFYQGWEQYAIGGSVSPSIKSEANFFVARNDAGNKEVAWRKWEKGLWNFYSVGDVLKNGASFSKQTGIGGAKPNYNQEQNFKVVDARSIKELTSESGVLRYSRSLPC